jgi:hypothetical protein
MPYRLKEAFSQAGLRALCAKLTVIRITSFAEIFIRIEFFIGQENHPICLQLLGKAPCAKN